MDNLPPAELLIALPLKKRLVLELPIGKVDPIDGTEADWEFRNPDGPESLDTIERLEARVGELEVALIDALGANNMGDDPLERARFFASKPLPEDPVVREICERHGYGAVMDSASRQWLTKDDDGERGAFVVGTCYSTWVRARKASNPTKDRS